MAVRIWSMILITLGMLLVQINIVSPSQFISRFHPLEATGEGL